MNMSMTALALATATLFFVNPAQFYHRDEGARVRSERVMLALLEDTYLCDSAHASPDVEATEAPQSNVCFDSYAQGNPHVLYQEREFIKHVGRGPVTDQELCDVYGACNGPEVGPVINPVTEYLYVNPES